MKVIDLWSVNSVVRVLRLHRRSRGFESLTDYLVYKLNGVREPYD